MKPLNSRKALNNFAKSVKKPKQHWTGELCDFAEKLCKHNDSNKYGNYLYWILLPILTKYFKGK